MGGAESLLQLQLNVEQTKNKMFFRSESPEFLNKIVDRVWRWSVLSGVRKEN